MTMRGGRRATLNARPPTGTGEGALGYVRDGFIVYLERPSDFAAMLAAGTPYVLILDVDGYPAWAIGSATVIASGYGNNFGNDFGGPP